MSVSSSSSSLSSMWNPSEVVLPFFPGIIPTPLMIPFLAPFPFPCRISLKLAKVGEVPSSARFNAEGKAE